MSFFEFDHITPLHEAYAASIGRGLVVCQHLESCAHHVMVTWAVTDRITEGESDREELRKVALGLRNVSLGGGIRRLEEAGDFGDERVQALEIGRQARNWLVHEAGDVIQVGFGPSTFIDRLKEFRADIQALCEADRVLSVSSYVICEREPVSFDTKRYAARLEAWVLAPLAEALESLGPHEGAG
ncbi:hypothetical protein ACGF5M_00815 [Gemmatimonadota bacterium]